VFEFDLDLEQHREILARYREVLRSDMPIRVVVHPGQAERYADLLAGIGTWPYEPVAGDLDGLEAEIEATER